MQIIKSIFKVIFFVLPVAASAQSTYLNQGSKEIHLLDRLEIKQHRNTDLHFTTLKPYSRKSIVRQVEFLDSARMGFVDSAGVAMYNDWQGLSLTKVDEYNMRSLLQNNSEWVTTDRSYFESKRPVLKTFYKSKANFFEVNTKDLFLAINPMLQLQQSRESGNDENIFLNTRGISVRGLIANKIGFSSFITENQERGPAFFQDKVRELRAVPGMGFFKSFKGTAVDYFDARGHLTFNATKYINFQLGYDKNFIGNGYRSLFLSDWGNSNLFAKINTKIWKFNYQNIFMELIPQFTKRGDSLLPRKYAAMHHLSMNVTRWLNIGLFEGVVFGRTNRFDFQYLNPIIFYRHIEGSVGSPDNAVAGLDFKANVAKRFQLYGQLMIDEFVLNEARNNPTSWVNKFGIQLGGKYIDAFGINNLDLQVETNRVRPFTYSHRDTIANYTHYNQPLAHPLGANFQEFIGILNYQPAPKWHLYARAIYYKQGLDSAGINFGGNIFRDYQTRTSNDGFEVGSGRQANVFNGFAALSYEFRENLFFELSVLYRNFELEGVTNKQNTKMISAGMRLNMFRRNYDF